MPANLENSAVITGLEKVSFHSNPKKGNTKECSNYHTMALILHTSKVISILETENKITLSFSYIHFATAYQVQGSK